VSRPLEPDEIDWERYDFIDLGCSSGGSIAHCAGRFRVERGLGIDIDPKKVHKTLDAGFDAVLGDARSLRLDREVSFVSMLDFLEHLPSLEVAEEILASAAGWARDFIYIKHPSFEGEERGPDLDVRQYWWGWHGHPCHLQVADYCGIFDRLGLSTYTIRYLGRVDTSAHPTVVPASAPAEISANRAAEYDDPSPRSLSPPLWRRQDIFIALRPYDPEEWKEVVRPTRQDVKLMRESGQIGDDLGRYPHLAPRRRVRE